MNIEESSSVNSHRIPYPVVTIYNGLKIIFFSLVFILVLGLFAEVVLRLKGKSGAKSAQEVAFSAGLVTSPFVGWRNAPNQFNPTSGRGTNNFGLRNPSDFTKTKSPGRYRTALFGSSVTFGTYVPWETSIGPSLEGSLKKEGINAEVMNFGVPGYNIFQVSATILSYIQELNLDSVIIILDVQMIFPTSPQIDQFPLTADRPFADLPFWEKALKEGALHSAALSWLDDKKTTLTEWREEQGVKTTSLPTLPPKTTEAIDKHRYEKSRRESLGSYLASIAAYCRERNIQVYFVTPYGPYYKMNDAELLNEYPRFIKLDYITTPQTAYGVSPQEAIHRETALVTDIIRRISNQYHAHSVDLAEIMNSESLTTVKIHYLDAMHFSSEGSQKLGEWLARAIKRDLH